jgi:hypothetical protein
MGQLAELATKLAFPAKYCSLAGNSGGYPFSESLIVLMEGGLEVCDDGV